MDNVTARVTAIIKTFERPDKLLSLYESLRTFYPTMKVIIVDDSAAPMTNAWDEHTEYVFTEYDIGLSAGRNLGVEKVQTPYCLLLDDDFIFTQKTKLENFVKILDDTEFQIVAGQVLDFGKKCIVFKGIMSVENDTLVLDSYKKGKKIGKLTCYDYVLNFFLAKTQVLRDHPWDPELKIREHEEFFWRLKKNQILITATPSVAISHFPTSDTVAHDDKYYEKRIERLKFFHNLACHKIGVTNFCPLGARYYGLGLFHYLLYLRHESEKRCHQSYFWQLIFNIFKVKKRCSRLFKPEAAKSHRNELSV